MKLQCFNVSRVINVDFWGSIVYYISMVIYKLRIIDVIDSYHSAT